MSLCTGRMITQSCSNTVSTQAHSPSFLSADEMVSPGTRGLSTYLGFLSPVHAERIREEERGQKRIRIQ